MFKYDWLVVLIDYNTKKKKIIVNDRDELIEFYNKTKDNCIYVGYNSRSYDSTILKGIILGMNPKELSDDLIVNGKKPFQISREFNNIRLYSYDTMITRGESLKQLEGFMGHMIKESGVNFNLDRKLTTKEIEETIYYCTHDVEETIKVFENTKSDFDAHFSLIKEFNLPLEYISKTKAQLSAIILEAERLPNLNDEMEYDFPNTVELGSYEYIKEHFDKKRYLTYVNDKGINKKNQLETEVYKLNSVYGFGGFHAAISKYATDNSDGSLIIHSDVALTKWGN